MENKYNVLIIGAGKISAFFDKPSLSTIITHSHAFTKNNGFRLLGFLDIDCNKAKLASEIWGGQYFNSLKDAFRKNQIDVVVIAVPDEYHYNVLKEVLEYEPKIIFLEKPVTKTIKQADEILEIINRKTTEIVVNYSRRFVNEYELIKNEILTGVYGKFSTGTCYYGKGVLHNGSHAVDLIRFLLSDIKDKYVTASILDYYKDDPSVTAELILENGKKFYLQAIDCNNYTIFGMDLLFEKGRIRFEDSDYLKIEKFSVKENKIFNGYKNLVKTYDYRNENDTAIESAVKNIYNYLVIGEKLKCTFKDGYEVLKVCLELQGKGITN
ncbi:MAG: Gfo/Idh/MocA family oxidoreductase [Bacillota bacterium]|nr:Gfo/Idh/MocA family oxidoreductase [Bacillota bacterium]